MKPSVVDTAYGDALEFSEDTERNNNTYDLTLYFDTVFVTFSKIHDLSGLISY